MKKYYTFAEAARKVGMECGELKIRLFAERPVTLVRLSESGLPIDFDFEHILIGDKVTDDGLILMRTNITGDIYRQSWDNVPAGRLYIRVVDFPQLKKYLVGDDEFGRQEAGERTRSVFESVWAYLIEQLKQRQYATCKEFYRHLCEGADTASSPFVRGEGPHRGCIIVAAGGQPISQKTLQNRWAELRKAAL